MRKFCDSIIHRISAALCVDCILLGENVCTEGFLSLSLHLTLSLQLAPIITLLVLLVIKTFCREKVKRGEGGRPRNHLDPKYDKFIY